MNPSKRVAAATLLCALIAANAAHATPAPAVEPVTPAYTSPGIGTLIVNWLFGR